MGGLVAIAAEEDRKGIFAEHFALRTFAAERLHSPLPSSPRSPGSRAPRIASTTKPSSCCAYADAFSLDHPARDVIPGARCPSDRVEEVLETIGTPRNRALND